MIPINVQSPDDERIDVQQLERAGAHFNAMTDHGETPLSSSANTLKLLEVTEPLQAGADPNACHGDHTSFKPRMSLNLAVEAYILRTGETGLMEIDVPKQCTCQSRGRCLKDSGQTHGQRE